MGARVFGGEFLKEIVFSGADYFIQARVWRLPSERAWYGQSRFPPHVFFPVQTVGGRFGCGVGRDSAHRLGIQRTDRQ